MIGEITPDMGRKLIEGVIIQEPILVLIDTGGGDIEAAHIISAFLAYNGQTTGLVLGRVDSAGIIVLQSCHNRIMMENATMFFHSTSLTPRFRNLDAESDEKIEEYRKSRLESQHKYESSIAHRCGLTSEQIREFCRQERRLTAKEAVEHGLADRVLSFEELLPLNILFPKP